MWESKSEKEEYERLRIENDKKAEKGLKKLKAAAAVELIIWILHIAVIGEVSWYAALFIIIPPLIALFGYFTNRTLGFYVFAAFLTLQLAFIYLDCHRLVFLLVAVFSKNGADFSVWFAIFIVVATIVLYCASCAVAIFDRDVRVWRVYGRRRI